MFVGVADKDAEESGRGNAASLRNSGMLKLRAGAKSARCGGAVRLSVFVDFDDAVCRAALQGTINVFAIDGQRSVVTAAMFCSNPVCD